MKINASLEAVRSKKDATDDIEQTIVFHVWVTADQIGELNSFYRKQLRLTLEEVP